MERTTLYDSLNPPHCKIYDISELISKPWYLFKEQNGNIQDKAFLLLQFAFPCQETANSASLHVLEQIIFLESLSWDYQAEEESPFTSKSNKAIFLEKKCVILSHESDGKAHATVVSTF